jgi:hypothetical protein
MLPPSWARKIGGAATLSLRSPHMGTANCPAAAQSLRHKTASAATNDASRSSQGGAEQGR